MYEPTLLYVVVSSQCSGLQIPSQAKDPWFEPWMGLCLEGLW